MGLHIKCDEGINTKSLLEIFNIELGIPVIPKGDPSETILEILMGTRQTREGSKPGIEYQFRTLENIRWCIQNGFTISMVIPAGPKKPGVSGTFVDLAELYFIKTLHDIALKVKAIYSPGIIFNIILEDASMELFEPELEKSLALQYYSNFYSLITVLRYDNEIRLIPESQLVTASSLRNVGLEVAGPILDFITAYFSSPPSYSTMELAMDTLKQRGWKGEISKETLEYYMKSFSSNYPDKDHIEIINHITLYLATSFARYKLNARKITDYDIISANAKRVPGVAFSKYDRIFYRTMPLSKTKVHIPFWRARGIIEVNDGEYCSKLFPFNQTPETEDNYVTIINSDGYEAKIRVDIAEN